YLALIATQELGNRATCITGLSPSVSEFQRAEAVKIAVGFDLNFETIDTSELDDPAYRENTQSRCYFCKSELYGKLAELAESRGIALVLDGMNADDVLDHRPGRVAAEERNVRSPLAEAGLTKLEIRQLSKAQGLLGWDKPASPCLSSRIAYGIPVTIERLAKVEKGEEFLRELGFKEFRVRMHGDLARLEISMDEMQKALDMEMAGMLTEAFRKFGFRYVTLDLEGFRSGAMNESKYQIEQLEKV
ncbi:MAG: ATP-dependent sacrificial sulfur transferase LarE, partial [Saprospiraceae bacterium]|nr:ATP-dependent sacrificial sulfur transferase LarE [Pyrinomonadaceae bacterium]